MKKQGEHIHKALVMMLFFIYALGLIKPVLPLIKDVLAHTFFKTSHMAAVHYENGRYHLHMELSEEAKKTESKQTPSVSNNDVFAFHIKSDNLKLHPFYKSISEINSPYINVSTDVKIPIPMLPPEC